MSKSSFEQAFEMAVAQHRYYAEAAVSYHSMINSPIQDNSQYFDIFQAWVYLKDLLSGYAAALNGLYNEMNSNSIIPTNGEYAAITLPNYGTVVFEKRTNVNSGLMPPFSDNGLWVGGLPDGALVHTCEGMYVIGNGAINLELPAENLPIGNRN